MLLFNFLLIFIKKYAPYGTLDDTFEVLVWRSTLQQLLKNLRNHYGPVINHRHQAVSLLESEVVCQSYPAKVLRNRFRSSSTKNHTHSPRQNRNPRGLFLPVRPLQSFNFPVRAITHM